MSKTVNARGWQLILMWAKVENHWSSLISQVLSPVSQLKDSSSQVYLPKMPLIFAFT